MTNIPQFAFQNLQYLLPENRIAGFPLAERDHAKLLHYHDGLIQDYHFYDISTLLPTGSLLIGNNTKVIPARLIFPKEEGSNVELFLLTPLSPDWSVWEVMVGNRRKFKEGQTLSLTGGDDNEITLTANWQNRNLNVIRLQVSQPYSIPEALEIFGKVPLPPYIKREMTHEDKERYQTVFAEVAGAVAAPTASLHFTERVLQNLDEAGIKRNYLTLHVGAGTFKPVKTEFASEHEMHKEQFHINSELLADIVSHLRSGSKVIASGTTSMRVLESLHYLGARIMQGVQNPEDIPHDAGFDPQYKNVNLNDSLDALSSYVVQLGGELSGNTAIFILPGFDFKICDALITNFHQPGSTLMALVSAFVGEDWQKIYGHALESDYRFLSYGDSSLLFRNGHNRQL
jgi:S-adenosylmethionine:tRNA ribosyltransferase-isomerase